MIQISNVSKSIENKKILNNINLSVSKGSIFGLIGPNGAGKTTLIKCLTGIYNIENGEIEIMHQPIFNNKFLKEKIAYVPDMSVFFDLYKVKDVLKFFQKSYNTFDTNKFHKINKAFKIPLNSSPKKLSKGMNMRLSLMLALCTNPEVLILDEPLSGIDPIVKRQVLRLLIEDSADRHTTIFISSHNLSDLEKICDTIAVMNNGEIKYTNSLETMKSSFRKLQIVFKENIDKKIEDFPGVISSNTIGRVNTVVTSDGEKFKETIEKYDLALCEEIDLSLEDIFIHSLGGDGLEDVF